MSLTLSELVQKYLMIRYILTIFLVFYSNFLQGVEVKCNFEEVYKNGQMQQGMVILKNNLLRYQYFDKDLFTIFYNGESFYTLENQNLKKFNKINSNTKMLEELISLSQKYPNIKNKYEKKNYVIEIERSLIDKFIKRISIKSNNLNMSIFFNNCKFMPINKRLFEFDPLLVDIER